MKIYWLVLINVGLGCIKVYLRLGIIIHTSRSDCKGYKCSISPEWLTNYESLTKIFQMFADTLQWRKVGWTVSRRRRRNSSGMWRRVSNTWWRRASPRRLTDLLILTSSCHAPSQAQSKICIGVCPHTNTRHHPPTKHFYLAVYELPDLSMWGHFFIALNLRKTHLDNDLYLSISAP